MRLLRAAPVAPLLLAGLATTLTAGALRAQDMPETAPAGVKLEYKHKAGQIQKFRLSGKMDMTMTPEGGAAGAVGAIPFGVTMVASYSEKVTGVKDNVASVAMLPGTATITTDALGNKIEIKAAGGKVTTLVNGQKQEGQMPGMNAESLGILGGSKPVPFKRDTRGRMTGAAVQQSQASWGGFGTNTVFELPEEPVSVGDVWETQLKVKPPLPGGGAAAPGVEVPEFEVQFTHTLKRIDTTGGKQHALIESVGSASTPEQMGSAVRSISQNYTSLTRFDIKRGAVVSGKVTMDMSMVMDLGGLAPPGAAGQPGAPSGLRIDGLMDMSYQEVPAAPAKAPAKKPVRKK
ncbi:MAG: hypothetical protein ACK47B_21055 [Armatimonadota bacterium]